MANAPPLVPPPQLEMVMETNRVTNIQQGDTFLPCHVCGERAGKHSYYGGQVCPSCRAFFRRSVQSGYNLTYVCVKNQECEMSLKTRKNCQFCRYKRCVEAGMKTAWVLTDEERKVKFEGRVKKKTKSEESSTEKELDDKLSAVDIAGYISDEELFEVNYYVEISEYHEMSKVHDMETTLIRDIIRLVAFQQSLSRSGQAQLRAVMGERINNMAARVMQWTPLTNSDKEKLLHHNIPILVEMQICTFFNPSLPWTQQITPLLGGEEVIRLQRKLRSLNVTGLDNIQLHYDQFSTVVSSSDKYMQDTVRLLSTSYQDSQEFVLISLVLLFCPDLLDLQERRVVEDIQAKFAVLLHKYLKKKHRGSPHTATLTFASRLGLINKSKELYWAVVMEGAV